MPEDRVERRPVEPAVVVRPPPYRRIHEPRDLLQRLIVPGAGQPPLSDRLPDRLGGLVADRRQEAHEELPPSILGPPGPKSVAKEVELDVLMLAPPVIVLAVHDLGLLRVKLKTALLQSLPDRFEHLLRLSLALGVNDHIVSVALEPNVRIGPVHPKIECVMHEEIRQQG
jgi:hypothetical protein